MSYGLPEIVQFSDVMIIMRPILIQIMILLKKISDLKNKKLFGKSF